MFVSVTLEILIFVISQQVVYLWLKQECNVDEIFTKLGQESSGSFLLEAFQILKVVAEVFRGLFASISLFVNLFPNAIDPGDLISQEVFVS